MPVPGYTLSSTLHYTPDGVEYLAVGLQLHQLVLLCDVMKTCKLLVDNECIWYPEFLQKGGIQRHCLSELGVLKSRVDPYLSQKYGHFVILNKSFHSISRKKHSNNFHCRLTSHKIHDRAICSSLVSIILWYPSPRVQSYFKSIKNLVLLEV